MNCNQLKKIIDLVLFEKELNNTKCKKKEELEDFLFNLNEIKKEISFINNFELALNCKEDLEELKKEYIDYAIVSVIDTQLRELDSKIKILKENYIQESREILFKKPCDKDNCQGFLYIDYHFNNPYLRCSSGNYNHKMKLTDKEKKDIYG